MNKLIEILIRWSTHRFGFHTDISNISRKRLVLQMKVIKTLIYGMKSSGNQAESGSRTTARIESGNFPIASALIQKDKYVDCLSGENSCDMIVQTTDDLRLVLACGGLVV